MVGLLSETAFLLGAETFAGVKLAFLFPLVLVIGYHYFQEVKSIPEQVRALWKLPITVGWVGLGLSTLLVLAFYVLRSGNLGFLIPREETGRSLLENAFSVRPRTKEFLVGYPAFFLAYLYLKAGGTRYLWVFWGIATMALISLFNTFCHIHTPLLISLERSCYGLLLGVAVGSFLFLLKR